jgi:hypothetical protein
MRIELFQSLYERYSNLSLSFDKDRPIAIRGLEKRLIQTLKTTGGYGVFDCYLHRFLLWQIAGDPFKRIESFHDEKIPSWSWMAYTGGIEYMSVPFGKVLWTEDIQSPFRVREEAKVMNDEIRRKPAEIVARAWRLVDCPAEGLVLDDTSRDFEGSMRCVVLGTEKEVVTNRPMKHYVLVVSAVSNEEADLYERVGVGVLEEAQIARDVPADVIRIA